MEQTTDGHHRLTEMLPNGVVRAIHRRHIAELTDSNGLGRGDPQSRIQVTNSSCR